MKRFIMINFILLHFINSNLYAAKFFVVEQKHIHSHHHIHNGSNHSHKHIHSTININFLDFFVSLIDINKVDTTNLKENYIETKYFISKHILNSIFRPPIV